MNLKSQIIVLLVIPTIFGILINVLKSKSLPFIAEPIVLMKKQEDLSQQLNHPVIREIGIEIAFDLYNKGTLFVDARAKEYVVNGAIPRAISNNDIDLLSTEIDSLLGFDSPFIIYCGDDDCGSSLELAYELQDFGFSNILVFKGGWKMWKDSGYEVYKNE